MRFLLLNTLLISIFVSCASGTVNYSKPSSDYDIENEKVVDMSFNKTWDHFIERLSSSVYTIEHMNKESGFINISLSSNAPSEFLDCGIYNVKFENIKTKQDITFNGADTGQRFTSYTDGNVHPMVRNTKLSSKVNVYFKKISPKKTSVKVNAKYVLNVTGQEGYMNNNYQWIYQPFTYSVIFSSGEVGTPDRGGDTPSCVTNGDLESFILKMLQ